MSDLLPHNATQAERALATAMARIGNAPVRLRQVWNPDTCPAGVLPWLAWAFSVDQWDPAWTEEQKRDTIRNAIAVQKIKGTPAAVSRALGALTIDARVLEWHRQQVQGAPYTYKLLIDARPSAPLTSAAQLARAIAVVDRVKSLRSHLDAIQVTSITEAGPLQAAVAVSGNELVVKYGGGSVAVSENNIVVA